ncbi:peptidase inhibitor 15-A-like [Saccostrea cucullata]|uniref:peptidase inhibitor 15-A-like n=1 Tax=Saccostrea cuccullata TaxID=36930 RepID=UPI002ED0FCA5
MEVLRLLLSLVCVVLMRVHSETIPVDQYKQQLLDVHNAYRAQQGAADMQALVWDDTLSKEAGSWIKRCNFKHEMKGRGENLAFDSNPKKTEELINSSIKAWYDEIKDYNYNRKSCAPRSCHYTQVVWAKTRKVGCAMEKCNYLQAFGRPVKNAWYLACYYDPKGNDISEYPFEKGAACSKCLQKQTCENKLCTGEGVEVCEDNDKDCEFWATSGECKRNPKFMNKKCRKACGICKGA